MKKLEIIGFGGGCHWCTEAVFQSLKGVGEVEQGYISTATEPEVFYEGVIVHYHPNLISLEKLIEIHLITHHSTSNHSMRSKYLSGIYVFNNDQKILSDKILNELQEDYDKKIITRTYDFGNFKASRPEIRNYYKTDPGKPFCKLYIDPKLKILEKDHLDLLK
ncbi:peptide-methionine (S)-S-oxide reductase [Christiangramia gaetbulicola]|uniref:peptide-methionine (S)-S-oxide reductase n=1 Tax=Christiangramia gaetbulicola TaxID=703340 RepID=A0A2T6AH23_9FLAO|nr:peptide-methionine (S)-S-oxide reductase [Christiangramia gaetbulicola]PTX43101.1 peptide-methionine (S)-S-oxide reductase [Christiangramia gaetbulicola]